MYTPKHLKRWTLPKYYFGSESNVDTWASESDIESAIESLKESQNEKL